MRCHILQLHYIRRKPPTNVHSSCKLSLTTFVLFEAPYCRWHVICVSRKARWHNSISDFLNVRQLPLYPAPLTFINLHKRTLAQREINLNSSIQQDNITLSRTRCHTSRKCNQLSNPNEALRKMYEKYFII